MTDRPKSETNIRPGQIILLNGAPRCGKSSIAAAIQDGFEGPWMNLGVDVHVREITPARYRPGIGLRPGGVAPEIENLVPALYASLYESIAAHSRQGLNVVSDVCHHDAYSRPLHILSACARRLAGLPVLLVGVRCSLETVLLRRASGQAGREGLYVSASPAEPVPTPVQLWQMEVHRTGVYDLEVDTSEASPEQCGATIRARLSGPPGTAFERLATAI